MIKDWKVLIQSWIAVNVNCELKAVKRFHNTPTKNQVLLTATIKYYTQHPGANTYHLTERKFYKKAYFRIQAPLKAKLVDSTYF